MLFRFPIFSVDCERPTRTSSNDDLSGQSRMPVQMGLMILVIVFFCGCKKGPVDNTYPGTQIAEVYGTLRLDDTQDRSDKVSFSVLWLQAYEEYEDSEPLDEYGNPSYYKEDYPENSTECDGKIGPAQTSTDRSRTSEWWETKSVTYEIDNMVQFSIPLYELPPKESRYDLAEECEGSGWYSWGWVIAYFDTDRNGVFDPASPEKGGDHLISTSFTDSTKPPYAAELVFLAGTLQDGSSCFFSEDAGDLQQGFNLLMWDKKSGTTRVFGLDKQIDLVQLDKEKPPNLLLEIQCREIEGRMTFNESSSDRSWAPPNCFFEEFWNPHFEESKIIVYWYDAGFAEKNNPCVVKVSEGMVCFNSEAEIPANWKCEPVD